MNKEIMTGEASRIVGCDRRTLGLRAEKLNIKPSRVIDGKAIYWLSDIEKIAKIYKEKRKSK